MNMYVCMSMCIRGYESMCECIYECLHALYFLDLILFLHTSLFSFTGCVFALLTGSFHDDLS